MKEYDYVIVGSGLFGATFANFAKRDGKKVLVIEKRNHLGVNIYTENIEGINVHKYGAHIFHINYQEGMEKYYTVNDEKNNELANKYKELAKTEENVIFGGRLAEYQYYDMDDVIKKAFLCLKEEN